MYSFYETTRSKKIGSSSANMYLQFKWDTENYANHRHNVKTAKASIDNSAPLTFTHMFIRPKKMQLELERYSTIQRNNRFLLERLATIQREGAWIDNKNYYKTKSLNTWKRQQEMIHLAYNNQIMIGRLQDVSAQYNRSKLEDEYLINQKYKVNIRKFPPNFREVQEHMSRTKAIIFKKVFDLKYQTKAYRKSRKLAMQRWTAEREKYEAAKAEKTEREAIEDEKERQLSKEKQKEAAKERKRTIEEQRESSRRWRAARKERMESVEQDKRKKEEKKKGKQLKIQESDMKRRQKEKQAIAEWKREEDERSKKNEIRKDEERKLEEESMRRTMDEKKRLKAKVQEWKEKKAKSAEKYGDVKEKERQGSESDFFGVIRLRPKKQVITKTDVEEEGKEITAGSKISDTALEHKIEDSERQSEVDTSLISSTDENKEAEEEFAVENASKSLTSTLASAESISDDATIAPEEIATDDESIVSEEIATDDESIAPEKIATDDETSTTEATTYDETLTTEIDTDDEKPKRKASTDDEKSTEKIGADDEKSTTEIVTHDDQPPEEITTDDENFTKETDE